MSLSFDEASQEAKENLRIFTAKNFIQKFEDLNQKLSNITDYSSQEYIATLREHSKVSRIVELGTSLDKAFSNLEEANLLSSDPELGELAEEQIKTSQDEIITINSELTNLIIEPMSNDEKKAIFEIRPGVGGIEASLFAEDLFKMYIKYCNMNGLKVEQFSLTYNDEGGITEAIFLVDQDDSFGKFRFEGGVHRVQRVPKTEALGRIHTSTASVVVIPQFEMKNININSNDIRIDVYRSSGPGGQSVNTTDSAVRITHTPTGIIVTCQNGKSQHKNKEMAMSVLYSKLQDIEDEKRTQEQQKLKKESVTDSDRSSKIRTYNFPQSRITDHRINESWFNINEVMDGYIGEILTNVNTKLRKEINQ
jgi:peptide chain release factor 1